MTLKAILFDFNGIIINDEPLHERLIEQLLIEENLRVKPEDFKQFCLGRSDRIGLRELLTHRGRVVTDEYLEQLIQRKTKAYCQQMEALEELPIYSGVQEFVCKIHAAELKMAVVSGALRSEIELILNRANIAEYFSVIVAGDDITTSKPDPEGYLLAIERLNQQYPELHLHPSECLAIEDTLPGIHAAQDAKIAVVGVAHTYPLHMLQRIANWSVDHFCDLELERVQHSYELEVA
ncbi:HAD hydrolase, IA, variant 1 family protein [Lyngbya aestuarii BL J]|uniref:HAD hydrolase, IA, variant 1 family protein n=1 Tax=Lyngbya aestuarii BL J TaxID=1348334 RepID=U7QKY0_9CYAN|nr:HAD family phosphatase [Lyngbya aestuarii]ERT07076.1 HAD hydrolase, IA, variant 1 family protein [Lyngbya aestuarii BL J]